jgi:hypothetical protein
MHLRLVQLRCHNCHNRAANSQEVRSFALAPANSNPQTTLHSRHHLHVSLARGSVRCLRVPRVELCSAACCPLAAISRLLVFTVNKTAHPLLPLSRLLQRQPSFGCQFFPHVSHRRRQSELHLRNADTVGYGGRSLSCATRRHRNGRKRARSGRGGGSGGYVEGGKFAACFCK